MYLRGGGARLERLVRICCFWTYPRSSPRPWGLLGACGFEPGWGSLVDLEVWEVVVLQGAGKEEL